MKLEKLAIWPRILAAKPHGSKATLPLNILRAVLAAGGLRQAGPVHCPQRPKLSQADRDARRAKADPKFRRTQEARRAKAQFEIDFLIHVACAFDAQHDFTGPGATGTWRIGDACPGESHWHRWHQSRRLRKWESGTGGVEYGYDGEIVLTSSSGKRVSLPCVPQKLRHAANLTEPHPAGYFAVPVKKQPGVFACFGIKIETVGPAAPRRNGAYERAMRGETDWSPSIVQEREQKSWVVVGFCLRGRLVPDPSLTANACGGLFPQAPAPKP